ncbi:8765_t:CDS:2 [Funneliformis geosporum]|uniref:8765_t:CDS:1 n=1 Tax=Funneliformis geosporum TaxID=1117311 RepID=A0A9W4WRI9_9GLOM|nr:8765_t:CDS:2 [Funneliformis geosporum]
MSEDESELDDLLISEIFKDYSPPKYEPYQNEEEEGIICRPSREKDVVQFQRNSYEVYFITTILIDMCYCFPISKILEILWDNANIKMAMCLPTLIMPP